jgi:hypothetical protein
MLIKPEPVEYDVSSCKYETLEIRDPLFTFDFINAHLKIQADTFEHKFTDKKLRNLGWLVHADGE